MAISPLQNESPICHVTKKKALCGLGRASIGIPSQSRKTFLYVNWIEATPPRFQLGAVSSAELWIGEDMARYV